MIQACAVLAIRLFTLAVLPDMLQKAGLAAATQCFIVSRRRTCGAGRFLHGKEERWDSSVKILQWTNLISKLPLALDNLIELHK